MVVEALVERQTGSEFGFGTGSPQPYILGKVTRALWAHSLICEVVTTIHSPKVPIKVDDVNKVSGRIVRNSISVSSPFPLEFLSFLYPSK